MVMRYFGEDGLAARIREHCRLAQLFGSWVSESSDWELQAPVSLGLVCFRACPEEAADDELDELNESIMHALNSSGTALISHTKLNNKFTLRLSIGNIRTTETHVLEVWKLLNQTLTSLK
jgi:aromatic-L-amino-acid decarboxylase